MTYDAAQPYDSATTYDGAIPPVLSFSTSLGPVQADVTFTDDGHVATITVRLERPE